MSVNSAFYVNRNPNNRKRHLDPDCRYLQLAYASLAELHAEGWYDDYEENEGEPPPTQETRFVEVAPRDEEEPPSAGSVYSAVRALHSRRPRALGQVPGGFRVT